MCPARPLTAQVPAGLAARRLPDARLTQSRLHHPAGAPAAGRAAHGLLACNALQTDLWPGGEWLTGHCAFFCSIVHSIRNAICASARAGKKQTDTGHGPLTGTRARPTAYFRTLPRTTPAGSAGNVFQHSLKTRVNGGEIPCGSLTVSVFRDRPTMHA